MIIEQFSNIYKAELSYYKYINSIPSTKQLDRYIIKPVNLNVHDEYSELKKVVVCPGYAVPEFENYYSDDPEEQKWNWAPWDKTKLLDQQLNFFEKLSKYNIDLLFPETDPVLIHQMYTRDTGFVINDMFFFTQKRSLKARLNEIEKILSNNHILNGCKKVELKGKIEGGDVIVTEKVVLVGISSRTDFSAVQELSNYVDVKYLYLGDNIMHLDTRLAILSDDYALACMECFTSADQKFLNEHFKIIPVSLAEAENLATNVFSVNPDTICIETRHQRISNELKSLGFNVEEIEYSEPIAFGGSFRCTTVPLMRKK